MRHFVLMVALLAMSGLASSSVSTAELDIQTRRPAENVSMQKGPANCSRWTDECVNCTRGADGGTPICSNIGFACQPTAIRCVSPETSGK